ncbi:methylated-DNA--[protein]-cysteine S-methyltransferase [Jongsikchunia kroppenstedtii]|uniref:methylated-DNA--[protein]-cysteine S-methyltransferase n=1 Tax=Jongsikchunia kroppenstedtii TaxID=1121721 RepID=UPI000375E2C4|nr:methylated-DNA--[protein]-cysteine S-methyltransferase [Jongsikchunia kroppenstedtii]
MSDVLDQLSATDETTLERLHRRLVTDAAANGLVDIAYRTIDSPVGSLLLAATDRGVVRVAFDVQDHDAVLAELAEQISPRVLRAPRRLDNAAEQLDEFFNGSRIEFDLALDLQLAHGFRREVLGELRKVPFGGRRSYGQLADAAGNPKAVRAVGTACARNPIPLIIPCHRVVRAGGTIGQYAGGPERKRLLLEMEERATAG